MRFAFVAVLAATMTAAISGAQAYETVRPPSVLSPDLHHPWQVPTSAAWRAQLPIAWVPPHAILTYAQAYGNGVWVYPRMAPPPAATPYRSPWQPVAVPHRY